MKKVHHFNNVQFRKKKRKKEGKKKNALDVPARIRSLFFGTGEQHLDHSTISKYRIYSKKRPGRLFNFGTLRVGTYSRVGAYFVNIFSK